MEKRLEAEHVFRYDVSLNINIKPEYIYTNIDFYKKLNGDKIDSPDAVEKVEDYLQELVFTKDKIEELKKRACEQIMKEDNPFNIWCGDWDGGYYIDSPNDLLENKIKIDL